jgi:hypothetical protein
VALQHNRSTIGIMQSEPTTLVSDETHLKPARRFVQHDKFDFTGQRASQDTQYR